MNSTENQPVLSSPGAASAVAAGAMSSTSARGCVMLMLDVQLIVIINFISLVIAASLST